MSTSRFSRRQFNQLLATGVLAGWSPAYGEPDVKKYAASSKDNPVRLQVAAIQMVAKPYLETGLANEYTTAYLR